MEPDEDNIYWMHPELKSTIQRDIITIFREWSKDPITFEKIKETLIERGQLMEGDGQERWLREKLKQLRDLNILIDIKLPYKKKAGRPPLAYRYNEKAVYKLFSLTEALVDAMGFAQLEAHNNQLFLSKYLASNGKEMKSLRADSKSGYYLDVVHKKATLDDLERAWRLYRHIQELQGHCDIESPIIKDYAVLKSVMWMDHIGERGPDIGKMKKEFSEKYGIAGFEKD